MSDAHVFTGYLSIPDLGYEEEANFACNIHYTPPCKGERENGVPVEPDTPETIEVTNIRPADDNPLYWIICKADDLEHDSKLNFDNLIDEWKDSIKEGESLVDYQERMRGEV